MRLTARLAARFDRYLRKLGPVECPRSAKNIVFFAHGFRIFNAFTHHSRPETTVDRGGKACLGKAVSRQSGATTRFCVLRTFWPVLGPFGPVFAWNIFLIDQVFSQSSSFPIRFGPKYLIRNGGNVILRYENVGPRVREMLGSHGRVTSGAAAKSCLCSWTFRSGEGGPCGKWRQQAGGWQAQGQRARSWGGAPTAEPRVGRGSRTTSPLNRGSRGATAAATACRSPRPRSLRSMGPTDPEQNGEG